ncbi:MAG: hypothetical protein BWZ03_00822 [bacterium ADurb.BinA186]|nr:MAG: hypothetical protein BWZ03_00822 [bacterium ADurb.BinA186]
MKNDDTKSNKDVLLTNLQKIKPSALVSGRKKQDSYYNTLAKLPCDVTKEERKKIEAKLSKDEANAVKALDTFIEETGLLKQFEAAVNAK